MRQIIKYFSLDLTASKTSEIVALTRPSVSRSLSKSETALPKKPNVHHRLAARSKSMNLILVRVACAGDAVAVLPVNKLSSASSNAMARFTPRSCRTAKHRLCKPLFVDTSRRKRSFIRTAGAAMTDWSMSVTANISELTTQTISLLTARIISMASKAFGLQRNVGYKNSTAFRKKCFICT